MKLKKFWRITKKYYIKLIRSKGTPHSIALAIALGLFIGCSIPMGGQTIIVVILAIILRTDKVLAFAATWISNPYTVTFMYPVFCFVGSKILGSNLSFADINRLILSIIHDFSWSALINLGTKLAVYFFVGGALFGIVIGGIGYFITYKLVMKYRNKKNRFKDRNKKNIGQEK